MLSAAVILLILPCLITGQQLVEVCDPANLAGSLLPPLPIGVPNQFSATIEGNLLSRSTTFVITEYYDQVNDRGKLEFSINGTKTVGIYDYSLGEVFIIPDPRGGDCRVFEISPTTPFLAQSFGFTEVNGSLHIGSPAAFLERVQENATTRYIGQDTLRGIPVHRWQSCVAQPNNTYLIDYYFASQANWTYGSQVDSSVMIPIQFTLNASFINPRRGIVDNAYNIYTFVDYKTGRDSVPDDIFTIPTGLACKGRIPGQPIPTLSNYFSGRIEFSTEFQGSPVLSTSQEYYDYDRKLFRLDYYDRDGPTTVVHDFNEGVQFRISQSTNKCLVTPLSDLPRGLGFDFDINSDVPNIASPSQLTLLENFFNYSYEGVSTVRGVQVDSWVSVRDFEALRGNVNITNALYEVFFTRPEVIVVNEYSVTTDPVVLRVRLSGDFYAVVNNSLTNFTRSMQFDFFDISTQEPPYDAYDVSYCYAHEDLVSVVMVVPGQLTGFNVGDLRENIRVAIMQFTGVSPLQIAGVNIVDSNDTHIFVHVRLGNLTTFSTIPQERRVNAATALKNLIDGTTGTTAQSFTFVFPPNITVTPSIFAHGQGRGNPSNCDMPTLPPSTCPTLPSSTCPTCPTLPPSACPTCPTLPPSACPTLPSSTCPTSNTIDLQNQLNLKNRELIGIAIGLLLGGIIIGALLMMLIIFICRCCICKGDSGSYKIGKNVQYEKHSDEVAFNT